MIRGSQGGFKKANDLLSDGRREKNFEEGEEMISGGGQRSSIKTDIYILSLQHF